MECLGPAARRPIGNVRFVPKVDAVSPRPLSAMSDRTITPEHILARIDLARSKKGAVQGGKQKFYAGRQIYHIARHEDSFRIRRKRVALVNCDGIHVPMTIPL